MHFGPVEDGYVRSPQCPISSWQLSFGSFCRDAPCGVMGRSFHHAICTKYFHLETPRTEVQIPDAGVFFKKDLSGPQ